MLVHEMYVLSKYSNIEDMIEELAAVHQAPPRVFTPIGSLLFTVRVLTVQLRATIVPVVSYYLRHYDLPCP